VDYQYLNLSQKTTIPTAQSRDLRCYTTLSAFLLSCCMWHKSGSVAFACSQVLDAYESLDIDICILRRPAKRRLDGQQPGTDCKRREGTREARVTLLTGGYVALWPCSPHAAQGHGYRGLGQTGRVLSVERVLGRAGDSMQLQTRMRMRSFHSAGDAALGRASICCKWWRWWW
jgi:hypothetical protein